MKGDEVDPQYAGAVDTSVARTARYLDLGEPRFAKDALTKAFKGIGLYATNNVK